MKDDAGGIFALDFIAGCGIVVVLLAVAFYVAAGAIASSFTASYATELRPLAEEVSEMLVCSPGSPPDWHLGTARAIGATFVGLSDGRPCILSEEKVYSLGFFNDSGLAGRLGLEDSEQYYGIRIEVSADDGSITVASGHVIDDGTLDVCKCVRLVGLVDPGGAEKSGKLAIYLWRKYEGTAGTGR